MTEFDQEADADQSEANFHENFDKDNFDPLSLAPEEEREAIREMLNPDYGKKMTLELSKAVEEVKNLDYENFRSEKGSEVIENALSVADDAPEASAYHDVVRKNRINSESFFEFGEPDSQFVDYEDAFDETMSYEKGTGPEDIVEMYEEMGL